MERLIDDTILQAKIFHISAQLFKPLIKEDIDFGLPAVGKLIDETASDIPKKIDYFFNSVAEGFEKFFTH